jgi:hypothetical protein
MLNSARAHPRLPARVTSRRTRQGLTLVEVALLLSMLGIVLAAGVPAFIRGLRTSKTQEAAQELERMFAAVAAYYEVPQPTPTGPRLRCLPESAGPTPERPSIDPIAVSFQAPEVPGSATWRAIGYEPSGPVRFRYSLRVARVGCGPLGAEARDKPVVVLRAEGDLDGDGVLSTFERSARELEGRLVLDGTLLVHDRIE